MEILIFSGEKFKLVERGRNGREMAYGKRIGTGEGHPAVSGETGDNPQESGGSVPGQPFVSWERFRYEGANCAVRNNLSRKLCETCKKKFPPFFDVKIEEIML